MGITQLKSNLYIGAHVAETHHTKEAPVPTQGTVLGGSRPCWVGEVGGGAVEAADEVLRACAHREPDEVGRAAGGEVIRGGDQPLVGVRVGARGGAAQAEVPEEARSLALGRGSGCGEIFKSNQHSSRS